MRIVHHPRDLDALPRPLALVPTMGALHEGHLKLVRRAKASGDTVVVSVFVNPTQFGPHEDFARYPRDLARDATLAASAGADVVYAPAVETMYPRKETTQLLVPEVAERYEGAHRPGHFQGVATVVLKLFNQVRPDVALFGRKDLQQCAVVRRMVEDLNVPVRLEFVPTVREADGLAMSSRNAYLSSEDRALAPRLRATLLTVAKAEPAAIEPRLAEARASLFHAGFDVDYLDLIDVGSFRPTLDPVPGTAVVVAARLGRTRLIDNVEL